MKEALGDDWNKNDVEMGQTFNKENAAKPLRDTFMLVLNSEVLNAESMGKFYSVSLPVTQNWWLRPILDLFRSTNGEIFHLGSSRQGWQHIEDIGRRLHKLLHQK